MVPSELTGEVSMGVLLVFLVSWRRGRYIGSDQQGDNVASIHQMTLIIFEVSVLMVLLILGVSPSSQHFFGVLVYRESTF